MKDRRQSMVNTDHSGKPHKEKAAILDRVSVIYGWLFVAWFVVGMGVVTFEIARGSIFVAIGFALMVLFSMGGLVAGILKGDPFGLNGW